MIGENSGHVLQPTALVNEAFIRLMSGSQGEWRDRVHFFSFASRLMRHILVDFARSQGARKRGQRATTFITGAVHDVAPESDFYRFVDLDKALAELAEIDEEKPASWNSATSAVWRMPRSPKFSAFPKRLSRAIGAPPAPGFSIVSRANKAQSTH